MSVCFELFRVQCHRQNSTQWSSAYLQSISVHGKWSFFHFPFFSDRPFSRDVHTNCGYGNNSPVLRSSSGQQEMPRMFLNDLLSISVPCFGSICRWIIVLRCCRIMCFVERELVRRWARQIFATVCDWDWAIRVLGDEDLTPKKIPQSQILSLISALEPAWTELCR